MATATTADKPSSALNTFVDVASTIGQVDAAITIAIAGLVALVLIIVGVIVIVKGNLLFGAIMIIIAFITMLLAYLYYYFVNQNKGIAAVAGVAAIANVFGGAVKSKFQNHKERK